MKNIRSDNAIQKVIICELWLLFFSILGEEITGVTDCRDNDTGSIPNYDDQGSSSAGGIHRPEIQNDLQNWEWEITSEREIFWDIPFL